MNGLLLSLLYLYVSPVSSYVYCGGYYYRGRYRYQYYCDYGSYCCFDNTYCCYYNHGQNIIQHSVYEEKTTESLSGGVIAGIVLGSVILVILLGIVLKYSITRCNKGSRAVAESRVIYVQPSVSTIPAAPLYPVQQSNGSDYRAHGMPPQYNP